MADISKIKLPDGTTYNLKDANALTINEACAGENILFDGNGLYDDDFTGSTNSTGWMYAKSPSSITFASSRNNGFTGVFPSGLSTTATKQLQVKKYLRQNGGTPATPQAGAELFALHSNDTVTVSFKIKANGVVDARALFYCNFNDGTTALEVTGETLKTETADTWYTYTATLTTFSNFDELKTADNVKNFGFDIRLVVDNAYYDGTSAIEVNIKEVKLEYGDTATEFSYSMADLTVIAGEYLALNIVNGSATGSLRSFDSTAEGENYTIGDYATTIGRDTKATGSDSVAIGYKSVATNDDAIAIGKQVTSSGQSSFAEGYLTVASGNVSHAEGRETTAYNYAHAEGYATNASGAYSHAEGYQSIASGTIAHAEGYGATASGYRAHAEGDHTIAKNKSQHTFGEYNIVDPSTAATNARGNYIEIVGNGTADNARSNARTLDWDGNEILAGKLTLGAGPTAAMDAITKQYLEAQGYLTLATLPIYDGTVTTP